MTKWVDDLVRSTAYQQWAPDRAWEAAQEEHDLFFMHYHADYHQVRAVVPRELELERYEGYVWVGIGVLEVKRVRLRNVRMPSWWRRFPEVDLVTYVSYMGRRGVYFLSIESHRRLFSLWTRWTAGLPYLYSGLTIAPDPPDSPGPANGGSVRVTSGPRPSAGAAMATLDLTYSAQPREPWRDPHSPIFPLLNQYSAFVVGWTGGIHELDEVHGGWTPVEADVEVRANTLGDAVGIDLPLQPCLAHFASSRYILTWFPRLVRPGRPGLAPTTPRPITGGQGQ